MASQQTSPSMAVTVDVDYWSLKPQVRDIQWSNQQGAWLAHLFDEHTGLRGSMKVCLDCITVHVYWGCDGKVMHHGFEHCDTNKPVYHLSYIDTHYDLEPNNRYVQLAILRTHRRKLVRTGRHGILEHRGYDPPTKPHGRHLPKCFRGSSPEYIIQGSGGLATSIFYRRCDGRFRNLAHQVLKMARETFTPEQLPRLDKDMDEDGATARSAATAVKASSAHSIARPTVDDASAILSVLTKRKRGERE